MALDLNWLTPQLAVGAHVPEEDVPQLAREHGVTRVVDLRAECCDDEQLLQTHGVQLLKLPTEDRMAVSQEMLRDGVRWVTGQLRRGERVYIHCQYGIGRSALLALCVLVHEGHQPMDAMLLAKDAREKVSPSPEQLAALIEFSDYVARRHERVMHIPTVNELGAIAWRHLFGRKGTGGAEDSTTEA